MIDSKERLGATDCGGYPTVKKHELFEATDFEALHLTTPPRPQNCQESIDSSSDEDLSEEFRNAEPGLGTHQLSKLLGLQIKEEPSAQTAAPSSPQVKEAPATPPVSNASSVPQKKTAVSIPANDQQLQARLQHQQETIPQWHNIVEKKLILKQGLIDKRKVRLLSRTYRMLRAELSVSL